MILPKLSLSDTLAKIIDEEVPGLTGPRCR
jgi:hypothetical protein